MPQSAPGDLTEDPGSFFLMLEHVFVLHGEKSVSVFFFGGKCVFVNCLEGTWKWKAHQFGEKFLEQFAAEKKTDPTTAFAS